MLFRGAVTYRLLPQMLWKRVIWRCNGCNFTEKRKLEITIIWNMKYELLLYEILISPDAGWNFDGSCSLQDEYGSVCLVGGDFFYVSSCFVIGNLLIEPSVGWSLLSFLSNVLQPKYPAHHDLLNSFFLYHDFELKDLVTLTNWLDLKRT